MPRIKTEKEVLDKAWQLIRDAQTIEELRQAQAVVLTLDCRFNLKEVSRLIGVSSNWVSILRRRFLQGKPASGTGSLTRGGRRHQNLSEQDEREFLKPFFDKAKDDALVVNEVKAALDERLGRKTSLAATYNMLHRHGWQKPSTNKRKNQEDNQSE